MVLKKMKTTIITAILVIVTGFAYSQQKPIKPDSVLHIAFDIKAQDIVNLQKQVEDIQRSLSQSQLPTITTTQINGILLYFTNPCFYTLQQAIADTVKKKPVKGGKQP